MGTAVTFDLYLDSDADRHRLYRLLATARAILHRVDAVFSTWRDQSPVSRLRRGEISLEECPAEVSDVVRACEHVRSLSGGWFDPWAMPGGFDPTGYVKGWAVQRALDLFGDVAVGAIVNGGGDIALFGHREDEKAFRVGIVHPLDRHKLACVVEPASAIATSGAYERGLHLIDPFSGRPGTRVASATVIGPDLGSADAMATALVVAGAQGLSMINELGGYEALLIDFDGNLTATAEFPIAGPITPVRDGDEVDPDLAGEPRGDQFTRPFISA